MTDIPVPQMHTYPATPINSGYALLSVLVGRNWSPVLMWNGRQCYVMQSFRVCRAQQGRTAYNAVIIRYLDDGSAESVPAGKFSRAKYATV